jgi:hypothetical protein
MVGGEEGMFEGVSVLWLGERVRISGKSECETCEFGEDCEYQEVLMEEAALESMAVKNVTNTIHVGMLYETGESAMYR